ncbi:MAG: DnaJ family domain-containing protein [Gammaproteobacteria bacterium]|nr:DnaJ family domain-containing protein [Gammaproteobacteria bacterium]
MWLLDELAEQHIEQAVRNGELDDLPGAGRRLVFEDDSLVPEHLRMAHKILRNAGFAPPAVIDRKSINALEAELQRTEDEIERRRIVGKMNCLQARLDTRSGERASMLLRSDYYDRVLERLAGK